MRRISYDKKKKVSPHYREETDAKEPTMSMQGLSLPVAPRSALFASRRRRGNLVNPSREI